MTADQFNMWLAGYLHINVHFPGMRGEAMSFDLKKIGAEVLEAARTVDAVEAPARSPNGDRNDFIWVNIEGRPYCVDTRVCVHSITTRGPSCSMCMEWWAKSIWNKPPIRKTDDEMLSPEGRAARHGLPRNEHDG